MPQVGAEQVGFLEVRLDEDAAAQIGAGQLRPLQIHLRKVEAIELLQGQIGAHAAMNSLQPLLVAKQDRSQIARRHIP